MFPVMFRTCLFHPERRATVWSGHVHMYTPVGEQHVVIGLCKACRKWEEWDYKINGSSLANHDGGCKGCYGKYDGSLR